MKNTIPHPTLKLNVMQDRGKLRRKELSLKWVKLKRKDGENAIDLEKEKERRVVSLST